jgi:hypothetical protein
MILPYYCRGELYSLVRDNTTQGTKELSEIGGSLRPKPIAAANRSPVQGSVPRNCSHEALPFVQAAAKPKLTGSIETQPGHHLAALSC